MDTSFPSPTPDVLVAQARFVRALARELLADEHAAEDLAQDTWLRFLRRPPREPGAMRAWLRAVTARLAVEGLRGRARRAAREQRAARAEALPAVEEELARTEVLRAVAEAVLALEEPYRTTVLLAHWRGWDARRIARETATPLATVRSRLQRAHQRLRERLDRSHGRAAWSVALASLPPVPAGGALALGALLVAGALAAGLLWLRAGEGGGADAALARLAAEQPEPAHEELELAQRPAQPAPAPRAELGPAPVVVRITGSVADRPFAELALPARPSAELALHVGLDDREHPIGRAPLAEATLRTDAEGRFAVELPHPGGERVFVRLSAEADASYRRVWHQSELAGTHVELALARAAHGVLHGSARDEQGAALAGVALDLVLESGTVPVQSDAEGAFALANARALRSVALRPGSLALLGWEGGRPLEEGGFTPLDVTLGPAATLALRVIDRGGAGLAGVEVRASLPECEQALLAGNADEQSRAGRTDEEGRVLLAGLWAGRKLRLALARGSERFTCEAMEEGRLRLVPGTGGGRPIVIAPGSELALEARIDVERDVAGVVRLADGAPAARARVEVADLGRGDAWSRPVLLRLGSDAAGRFAGRLRTVELVGPLRVTASAPELAPERDEALVQGLGYAGGPAAPDVASLDMPAVQVDVAVREVARLAELALTLGPRHSLCGTLLGRDGLPVTLGMGGSRVWAAPAGSAHHKHGAQASAVQGRPGAFEIPGLEPGRYDVFVSEELEGFYTFENFLHRFPGLEAGGAALELRLPERREVRIRVRLAGGEPSSAVVLHRRLFPERAFEAERARAVERVHGAQGWPAGSAFGFAGIGGGTTELGPTSDGYDSFAGREHELQPLEPGYYVVGVHARGPEGAPGFFPQATGLLRFEQGEHVVEFELLAATTLRGRVRGDAAGEFLAVALVDERGALVPLAPLPGFTHALGIADTSASGEFVLHHAPTGAFRLRVGARAELERGAFRREIALELRAGETPWVEVRM